MKVITNPLEYLRRRNFILKIYIAVALITLISIGVGAKYVIDQDNRHKAEQMLFLKQELQKKDQLLKEKTQYIKDHAVAIKETATVKNKLIADMTKRYPHFSNGKKNYLATVIAKHAKRQQISPYLVYATAITEDDLNNAHPHSLSYVIGTMGVNWRAWAPELKEQKIAYSMNDLRNVDTNFAAGSYILGTYIHKHGVHRGLQLYKGIFKDGHTHVALAQKVINIAMAVKHA